MIRKNSVGSYRRYRESGLRAFTLLESLIVIGILALLASLLLPALSQAKSRALTSVCLSNKRQIAVAWHLYATDHDGRLVLNDDGVVDDDMPPPHLWNNERPWVNGSIFFGALPVVTNYLWLTHPNAAAFGSYVPSGSWRIYKCPEDRFLSRQQRANNFAYRVRNVTMNLYLGDEFRHNRGHKKNFTDNKHGKFFHRITEIRRPSDIFLVGDTHPGDVYGATQRGNRGIDETGFIRWEWYRLPGALHNGGGTFAYTDGHAALKRWEGSAVKQPVEPNNLYRPHGNQVLDRVVSARLDKKDLWWIIQRATELPFDVNTIEF